jgi:outer membrane protein
MNKSFTLFSLLFFSSTSGLIAASRSSDPTVSSYPSLATSTSTNGPVLRLKDCFELAVAQSESLKNQQELIEQSQANARAALSGALPHLRWVLTDLVQDTAGNGDSGGVSGTLTRKERIEHRFSLDQTLFAGLRNVSASKGFKKEVARDELLLRRAGVNLFGDVANAFYGVILAETTLGNTRAALALAQDRVRELKERANLGKSRESEVLSAESQVASLKAEESANIGDVSLNREILSFIVGKDISVQPLEDQLPADFDLPTLEEALSRAQSRSDVSAQKEEVHARQLQVRYERGGYWPSLNLTGNYYTKRVGFQDGIDWDALFTFNLPIYQGGEVSSNVRQSLSELRQAENSLSLISRQVESLVKRSRIALSSSIEQSKALSDAYRTAKRSYDLQTREYRLGIVNNLDVLAALNAALQSKQNLDETTIRKKLNYLELKTTIEDDLKL